MSFRKQKGNENLVSLDDTLEVNNDISRLSLKESIPDDFDITEYCREKEEKDMLHSLISRKLQGRERQVIILRYGLGGNPPMTQQQVCEILNISRSYVSRIETKAIKTLKENILR